MATVDVVIPTRERPQLTFEAAQSVLSQSMGDIHLYIVEDGDFSFSKSPYFQEIKNDPRVFLIKTKSQRGPAFCRNLGARLGKSPFLAFLDSDDLWLAQKLQKQLAFFEKNKDIHYQHCEEIWLKNGQRIYPQKKHKKQGGFFLKRAFALCLISPSAVMFRRSFWEKFGGFAEAFFVAEDYELWLRLNLHFPVGFIEEPLVIKRAGSWPQLSQKIEIDRFRVLALHRLVRKEKKALIEKGYLTDLCNEAIRKCNILYRGANKYGHLPKARKYHLWEKVFLRLRTLIESGSGEGTDKNSSA